MAVQVSGSNIGTAKAKEILAGANETGRLYIRDLEAITPRGKSRDLRCLCWDLRCLGEMSILDGDTYGVTVKMGSAWVYISGSFNGSPFRDYQYGIITSNKWGTQLLLEVDLPRLEETPVEERREEYGLDEYLVVGKSRLKELRHLQTVQEGEIQWAKNLLAERESLGSERNRETWEENLQTHEGLREAYRAEIAQREAEVATTGK